MQPLEASKKKSLFSSPARAIVTSFFAVIFIGAVLLTLPICSKDGGFMPFLDALFTATSATCVTGLVVVDTYSQFTILGQIIILILIQIGGLGLLTFATFFNIAIGRRLGLKSMQLAQESLNHISLSDVTGLIKMVVFMSLCIEAAGAAILCSSFIPKYGMEGIFIAVFLAVSAFCNAGIDILGREGPFSSLMHYNQEPVVLITIAALIIVGGLGFVVWNDLYHFRKTRKLLLHTKIVLFTAVALIIFGTVVYLICEWDNPGTLKNLPASQKVGAAAFLSVSARTAGFNSISLDQLTGFSKIITLCLMFIGAAPGSTGGGIKTTTFVVIIMTVVSVIRGKNDTVILHRKVGQNVVNKALAIMVLAIGAVTISTMIIYFSHDPNVEISGIDAAFESVSAFATVGLSTGITPFTNVVSRIALIATMFIGRVGPVSLALSLAITGSRHKNEVIPEGKILVG